MPSRQRLTPRCKMNDKNSPLASIHGLKPVVLRRSLKWRVFELLSALKRRVLNPALNNKKLLAGIALVVILVAVFTFFLLRPSEASEIKKAYAALPTQTAKNLFLKQSAGLTKPVDPELLDLDKQAISCSTDISGLSNSNPKIGGSCIGPASVFDLSASQLFLGGQCCGAMMNTMGYHKQLEALKKYSSISDIPPNPYKTPIELAKKLIEYDKKTILTTAQQKIYDNALSISKEGPCCCKCWHWYVNEGLAKKLIIEHGFTAEQVADVWDSSDICG